MSLSKEANHFLTRCWIFNRTTLYYHTQLWMHHIYLMRELPSNYMHLHTANYYVWDSTLNRQILLSIFMLLHYISVAYFMYCFVFHLVLIVSQLHFIKPYAICMSYHKLIWLNLIWTSHNILLSQIHQCTYWLSACMRESLPIPWYFWFYICSFSFLGEFMALFSATRHILTKYAEGCDII